MASIFTRIISGEIPAAKIYEDTLTLALLDINPASRGHTLVIPKAELPGLLDLPPDLVTAMAHATQTVAKALMTALRPDGFNVLQNNGQAAGQVVMHYHVHIIPRWAGDRAVGYWKPGTATADELRDLAALITAAVGKAGA